VQQREEKKNWTKEQKQQEKEEKAKLQEKYGWAIVDGHKQKVRAYSSLFSTHVDCFVQIGNFRVEPPGLFLGRGEHPKTGFIKKRIMPEDVTINIGKNAKVPPCPVPGHSWKAVVHDNSGKEILSLSASVIISPLNDKTHSMCSNVACFLEGKHQRSVQVRVVERQLSYQGTIRL